MKFLDKIFGRSGNRMFQMAALYRFMTDLNKDIFCQNPEWFEKYGEEIKTLYREALGGITKIDKIAIHVRAGKNPSRPDEPNYYENPFYHQLTYWNYYRLAMHLFYLGSPPDNRPSFLVFSDNIWYARTLFNGTPFDVSFADNDDEEEDFRQMVSCTGHIIANSSFSWWAAYLSPHNGTVYAPKKWFTEGNELNPNGTPRIVLPKEWLKI